MRRALVILALLVSACAEPTAYAPADAGARAPEGYTELKIEPGRWRVAFSGNTVTSREAVEIAMLHRAAEIALREGGDWFRIVDEGTDETLREVAVVGGFGPWPYRSRFDRRFGFGPGYGLDTIETRRISRFSAHAEIIVGAGEKPAEDPLAYDARAVMAEIGPRLSRAREG